MSEPPASDRTLNNQTLNQVYATLTKNTSQQPEFIPQIFYALHQFKEDSKSGGNSLETATSSIRHRIKLCKSYLREDPHCIELLSRPYEDWPQVVEQKQQEIETKKLVHKQLGERIRAMIR
ncbi:Cse2p Ecym_2117 [Eremothecium cymbalariae DBVPG|uniref:Mediator of RNA polymerase II transcription subunit 9 n=1 Tax=Eremothecium cymbalariae (strain CBS 270.75 / DBVPG 7215 / KCTC 17166 / NRRL Y-17582) TaxID=931890 RepID=G8JPM1_ERECY|nr:Hypothetical protein Ecym_2117 [Eremothecium cymbalariae DBVPG\